MATYQILYWKHIPAQVRVFEGRKPISQQMPDRFQTDIDRTAMREGLTGTDEYLDQWQWTEKRERTGDARDVLKELVKELASKYDNSTINDA